MEDNDLILLDVTDISLEDANELEEIFEKKGIRWKWIEDWAEEKA